MDERLQARMRELDERLGEIEPPARLERRVMTSIAEPRSAMPSALVLVAVGAALVLAFWLGRSMRGDDDARVVQPIATAPAEAPRVEERAVERREELPPARVALWNGALAPADECRVEGEQELAVAEDCRLELRAPALAMDVWEATRIARTDDGVRVLEGELLFAVEKVAAGAPRVRVEVAAGAIEVLGTRFAVVQHGDEGHVDLLEGAIAFVDLQGSTHAVEPGQRLKWSQRAVVVAPRAAVRGKPSATATSDKLDTTLEQVAALRRASRWGDAIALLHRARRELKDGAAAEILSYEEGTLRAHQDDAPAMCAYWRGHVARFGAGVHAPNARTQLVRAGCGDP
jgi:ferric-dicitrate binding protein FerR (iron transport regulator)